ncbi:hypothetical protein SKAU_G00032260 [Synaphobranchus kaupii]|uniref:Uncharacterized protein n=1 Tax=Synaphobranchus kaupii TaxID=118154 RepID=A0A9Q1GF02_SYNKA|nr:hypothetical protein SKAU_G00032260 [Synaphobranchus kaupii]
MGWGGDKARNQTVPWTMLMVRKSAEGAEIPVHGEGGGRASGLSRAVEVLGRDYTPTGTAVEEISAGECYVLCQVPNIVGANTRHESIIEEVSKQEEAPRCPIREGPKQDEAPRRPIGEAL